MSAAAKAVFLDRDGTINVDKEYIFKIKDFAFISGSVKALQLLQDAGFLLIIITSQSGIGRGYYSMKDYNALNRHMLAELKKNKVKIKKVYYCPHSPEESCKCRKPSTFFIREAQKRYNINLKESYCIGDKTADIKMGKNAGCITILVKTGKAGKDKKFAVKPDNTAKDLYDAARLVLKNEAKQIQDKKRN
jgi:D-glycero-D-manno-heptose 1,7-bisphosphate phosphatase